MAAFLIWIVGISFYTNRGKQPKTISALIPYEGTDRAVVGPLCGSREVAGGKLPHLAVIVKAFTAVALAGAGIVCAVAHTHVLLEARAVHSVLPHSS
jgi:hypothetical protein